MVEALLVKAKQMEYLINVLPSSEALSNAGTPDASANDATNSLSNVDDDADFVRLEAEMQQVNDEYLSALSQAGEVGSTGTIIFLISCCRRVSADEATGNDYDNAGGAPAEQRSPPPSVDCAPNRPASRLCAHSGSGISMEAAYAYAPGDRALRIAWTLRITAALATCCSHSASAFLPCLDCQSARWQPSLQLVSGHLSASTIV